MTDDPEPAKSFAYDLLADWRRYAEAPLFGSEWTYHGTVTIGAVTGALTWRHGSVGMAVGALPVCDLGILERLRIGNDIQEQRVAGWETVPIFWERSRSH